jgi:bifunctional UDP-N-acetylglucosamine pyrophosphorylase/glucosamine-1-phosphate N-acetyltransferase
METNTSPGNPAPCAPTGVAVVVLAAGNSTRMVSKTPKALHHVGGIPIVKRVIEAGLANHPDTLVVVVNKQLRSLPESLGMVGQFDVVEQATANGTGGALQCALPMVEGCEWIVSLLGDNPLLAGDMIADLIAHARETRAKVGILTAKIPRAEYGRIAHDDAGNIVSIVEWGADDQAAYPRDEVTEINSGIMVVHAAWAKDALRKLTPHKAKSPDKPDELYLTDLIELAVEEYEGGDWPVTNVRADGHVAVGVNSRIQQAEADMHVRERVRDRLMKKSGVTMIGPDTIFVDEQVTIGQDTIIHPFCYITGNTIIGEDCVIGPHAVIHDSTIGDGSRVVSSTVADSTIEAGSSVGPYARLREGAAVGPDVHIGNFVEVKNSELGEGTKAGHLAYLGDATVGQRVNVGAGVITANFDGTRKNRTVIGDDAFIGSDSVLVAPRTVGERGRTAAGSVVTHDVAPDTLVVGVPARPRTPGGSAS